ncbi:MAG: fused MFS/spermidine synthase [Planctomycetes bacterium]|nr:fused MFS/spermidine synthase [Planctomycetota bacterium]
MNMNAGQRGALLGLFVLSGASSLVYQILWVRELSLVVGSTAYAVSLVVSAFMAGLALGSAWLGKRGDELGSPLKLYALLEAGIGIYALLVPLLMFGISKLAAALAGVPHTGWILFVLSFLVLIPPTVLMGGTLPILSRYVTGYEGSRGSWIGALYGFNTAGAILGTALAGFVLIRAFGIRNTTYIAASANLVVVGVALGMVRAWPAWSAPAEVEPTAAEASEPAASVVVWAYLFTGMCGLGLEVAWTRAVVLFAPNSVYAFTMILTVFLLGIALGSMVMSLLEKRIERPAVLFGGLQCLVGLVAALTPIGLSLFGLEFFVAVATWFKALGPAARVVGAAAPAVFMIFPATILMGASFPLLARVVAGHTKGVSASLGRAYALNTVGAVLGSLGAGFVFLPWIGIQRTILLFAAINVLAGLSVVLRCQDRRWSGVGVVALLVSGGLLAFAPNFFRRTLERGLGVEMSFYREGLETTVGVYLSEEAERPVLVINKTALDDHGVVHQLLAHIPATLHPDPQRVLTLGFGVGITSHSFSTYDIPENHCVEISPGVIEAAAQFRELNHDVVTRGDPRFKLHLTDGRRYLLASERSFDIIALDANSGSLSDAGVGKLYTREFFELCRERLRPGGMVTLYVSLFMSPEGYRMISQTFLKVFPHTSLWIDRPYGETTVLLGSLAPLEIDVARYRSRVQRPAVKADLATFALDPEGGLLGCFLFDAPRLSEFSRGGVINSDDHPVMEYFGFDQSTWEDTDRVASDGGFLLLRESILPRLRGAESAPELVAALRRAERSLYPLLESRLLRRLGTKPAARQALLQAAFLEPEEYLYRLLGASREALARAGDPLSSARLHRTRGEWAAASKGYREALAKASSVELSVELECGLRLVLARCLGREGALGEARAEVQRARARAKGSPDEARLLAYVRVEELRLDPARRAQQALSEASPALALSLLESPRTPADWNLAGRAYLELGDPCAASHAFAQAGQGAEPEASTIARLELALVESVSRSVGETGPLRGSFGIEVPRPASAERVDHRRAEPWLALARLYRDFARPSLALRKALAARSADPEHAEVYPLLAELAALAGNRAIRQRAERELGR